MNSFGFPRHWKKFLIYLFVLTALLALVGWFFDEKFAAFSVFYGGTLSLIYLLLLVLTAKSYGDKIHLFLQILSGLRLPIVAFALSLGYFLPILQLSWTLIGFAIFYPLLFIYCWWE